MKRAWLPSPDRQRGAVQNTAGWRKRQRKQVVLLCCVFTHARSEWGAASIFSIVKDVFAIQSIQSVCRRAFEFYDEIRVF